MSDYNIITDFAAKDDLLPGNPAKAGKGTEIAAELQAIATAIASKSEADGTETLTNKSIDLASNTLTGTTAQFNTALSDGNFATQAGTETITNKTLLALTNTIEARSGPDTSAFSFRNRLINGGMMVDQRNAGAPLVITATTRTYTVDRWCALVSGGGQVTVDQVDASSGDVIGSSYAVTITTSTADASVGAAEYYQFAQPIEGLNVADLYWGTASARRVTLSFRCSVSAGMVGRTFSGSIIDSVGGISYPFSYTPTTSYTAFRISIPGPTSGTWPRTNAEWGVIRFNLGSGTSRLGTSQGTAASDGTTTQSAGTWQSGNFDGATGTQGIIDSLNATITIKDVQFEIGQTATPFETRPVGVELALCKRYLPSTNRGMGAAYANNSALVQYHFDVPARTAPTGLTLVTTVGNYQLSVPALTPFATASSATFYSASPTSGEINWGITTTPWTAGQAVWAYGTTASGILWTGCEL